MILTTESGLINQSNVAFHPCSPLPRQKDDFESFFIASFQFATKKGSFRRASIAPLRFVETNRHFGSSGILFHSSKTLRGSTATLVAVQGEGDGELFFAIGELIGWLWRPHRL